MLEKQDTKSLYWGGQAKRYDLKTTHLRRLKRIAIQGSAIKPGNTVAVFCCGTGMEFPFIYDRVGNIGQIIGVDFSSAMLEEASKKAERNRWSNIRLIHDDITEFDLEKVTGRKVDVAVCILGLSIISDYMKAFNNIVGSLRNGGEVIIGDMQLSPGIWGILDPITVFLSKPFGGSYSGHRRMHALCRHMETRLWHYRKKAYLFKSFFLAWGKNGSDMAKRE